MADKIVQQTEALALLCPTCGARYTLPKYVEGQKYGCKRCSASLMFGKFALQQELGRGGFGVVYKAFQADLQRVVALKFLHTDSDDSTERFMREARIAANLNHPNITAIYEVGQHEGKPYITMQFVDGMTTNKASFTIREAVSVVRDAAVAVDYAHGKEVIHRDLKPHNIMIQSERSGTSASDMSRRTYVMDFGLARSTNQGGTLTTEGQVMGTPAFMSPEQAEGRPCDPRSDVYSLGATLYSLATKRPPFEAPTPLQILMQVTQNEPSPPSQHNPEIDKGLEAIILKAMAKDPAQRYRTASAFAQDLTSWLGGGVTDAGPTLHLSASEGALLVRRRKRGAMVAVGLALILAGAGGLAWSILSKNDKDKGVVVNPLPKPDPGTPKPPDPVFAPVLTRVLLEVRSDPSEATLRIENKEWKTPAVLNESQISPGTYDIVLSKPGFKPLQERVTLTAGPAAVVIEKKLEREPRKVAFTVASDPPGAKVFLKGTDTGAQTPHTIYQDEVGGSVAQIELELAGYQTATRSYQPDGETKRIALSPKLGSFFVSGVVPGSTVHLIPVPPGVKNVRAVAGLWSENPRQLEQALGLLDPADLPLVVERLKSIAVGGDAPLRERAAKLASVPGSPTPVKPERTTAADSRGSARLENAWVLNRYRLFATSPRSLDYLSEELEPRMKDEIPVRAEMVELAVVGAAAVRPALGSFKVVQSDQTQAGTLTPGGPAVRVMPGPVSLHYTPPANDPLLREFTVNLSVSDRYDLAGNLYLYAAEAYEKDLHHAKALRSYQKVLDDRSAAPDPAERAKLAERIRTLHQSWIDGVERQGKPVSGDAAAKIDESRRKPPADAIPALMELATAREISSESRGSAASALAMICAKESLPYEAMEWIERAAKDKVDPGANTAAVVVASIKGYPGLAERWDAVAPTLEALRKGVAVKDPAPPPPPPPVTPTPPAPATPVEGKLGAVTVANKYGIYVRLDMEATLVRGETLQVLRGGEPVGEVVVEKLLPPDKKYPRGAAECRKGPGSVELGDEVRRKK